MPTVKFLNQEIAFMLFDRYKNNLHTLTETLKPSPTENLKISDTIGSFNKKTIKKLHLQILAILYLTTRDSIYYSKIYDGVENVIYYIESDDLKLAFKKACLQIVDDEVKINHFVRETLNRDLSTYRFLNLQPFYKTFFTSLDLFPGQWYYFDKEYIFFMESVEIELIAELEVSDPTINIDQIRLTIDKHLENAYYKYLNLLETLGRYKQKISLLEKKQKLFKRIEKKKSGPMISAYFQVFDKFPVGFNNASKTI